MASGGRKKESKRSDSTAGDICITDVSKRWPMRRAKQVWSSRMATITATSQKKLDAGSYQLKDQVLASHRVTKVVKGGKNISFAALRVVGDPAARSMCYGSRKAKESPHALR